MKRISILVGLLLTSVLAFSENEILDMFFPDHKASPFYFDGAVFWQPVGTVAAGGFGLNFNAGLNLGWFLNKDLVIAPFAGVAPCFINPIQQGFINDLKNNYQIPDGLTNSSGNSQDIEKQAAYSAGDYLVKDIIAGENLEQFTITMRYGVLIKLPWRYCPPVAVYGLWRGTAVAGTDTSGGGSGYRKQSYGALGVWASGYGAEIYLFRGSTLTKDELGAFHLGHIALAVEMTDMKTAIVKFKDESKNTPDIYLNEFTTDTFDRKYSTDWRISIHYGFHIL